MDRDERIRQRAHELWEREGRPEGRHAAHWEEACREIDAAERAAAGGAGEVPPAARADTDPDTGAALALDPTGWMPPGDGGPAGDAPPAAKRSRRKPRAGG